jgi:hypothetical protein
MAERLTAAQVNDASLEQITEEFAALMAEARFSNISHAAIESWRCGFNSARDARGMRCPDKWDWVRHIKRMVGNNK